MLSMRSCNSMHCRTRCCDRAIPRWGSRSICCSISCRVHDMTLTLSMATADSDRAELPHQGGFTEQALGAYDTADRLNAIFGRVGHLDASQDDDIKAVRRLFRAVDHAPPGEFLHGLARQVSQRIFERKQFTAHECSPSIHPNQSNYKTGTATTKPCEIGYFTGFARQVVRNSHSNHADSQDAIIAPAFLNPQTPGIRDLLYN